MDILVGKILLFLFFPYEAGQNSITTLVSSPSTYPWDCDSQEDKQKQRPKSHLCLSLHYCPWRSNGKIHLKLPGAFAMAVLQLRSACKLHSFVWGKNNYCIYWTEGIVFGKQSCIRTEVSGIKKSSIRKEGQSCNCSTHQCKYPLCQNYPVRPRQISLSASVSHVWGADNVSFVYFGNSKHNIFWSRSRLLQWLCKAPVSAWIEVRGQQLTWDIFSWHRRQGHCWPPGFPPQTSPSHSPIAAQSSLSFAGRVGFCLGFLFGLVLFFRAILDMQSLSRGSGWSPPLVIFCLNSCQQVPQLMKGK